jgi:hypothetical protein
MRALGVAEKPEQTGDSDKGARFSQKFDPSKIARANTSFDCEVRHNRSQ